ncbi:MAG: hypothetical protein NZO58_10615 [Gemmataceae bacterium]|nr:hypothetical protein [Gemmataceae bacterium]
MVRRAICGVGVIALVGILGLSFRAQAEGTAKSGPAVGTQVPGPFHPLNINGENAGQKACLYCAHGANPVAVVFAREVSPPLTDLLKKLEAATVKYSKESLGSFAVFCNDKEGLKEQLEKLAADLKLKNVVLALDAPSGPKDYKIAKDADVTVILYEDFTVRFNHAFKKGELNATAVDRIVADVAKIIPKN